MIDSPYAFTCTQRTAYSFDCDDTDALARLLMSKNFEPQPTKQYERYRLVSPDGEMIAVLYESCTVLAQGKQAHRLAALIARVGGAS